MNLSALLRTDTAANLARMVLGLALSDGFRYFLFAGLAWLSGYVWFRRRWARRKIIPEYPAAADLRRELAYSVLTVLVYGVIGTATIWATWRGWTRLYWEPNRYGWTWFWLSIPVTILLHDTWFYWTHRLLHHPRVFRWCHRVHHQSRNPSPWAAYAFDPIEAAVQATIFPLAVSLYPVHPLAFLAFMVWQIIFNVLGHTGYEYHPSWLLDSWLGKILNTPTNHTLHHEYIRGNYGLYFNVWDRLMGTNHAKYESRFREVTRR